MTNGLQVISQVVRGGRSPGRSARSSPLQDEAGTGTTGGCSSCSLGALKPGDLGVRLLQRCSAWLDEKRGIIRVEETSSHLQ